MESRSLRSWRLSPRRLVEIVCVGPIRCAPCRIKTSRWCATCNELRALHDCGDSVVAAVSWHTRPRGSERELINEEAHTWTLREGRIARFEWGAGSGEGARGRGLP